MSWFNRSVGRRLATSFIVLLVGVFVVAVVGIRSTTLVGDDATRIAGTYFTHLDAAAELAAAARDGRTRAMRMALIGETDEVEAEARKLAQDRNLALEAIARIRSGELEERAAAHVDRIERETLAQFAWNDQILAAARRGDRERAKQILNHDSRKGFREVLMPAIEDFDQYLEQSSDAALQHVGSIQRRGQLQSATIAALLGVIGAWLAWTTTLWIVRPLRRLADGMARISLAGVGELREGLVALAHGELNRAVDYTPAAIGTDRRDELGQVCASYDAIEAEVAGAIGAYDSARGDISRTVDNIQHLSGLVQNQSGSLRSACGQLADSSEAIAASAQESAAATTANAHHTGQVAEGGHRLEETVLRAAREMAALEQRIQEVRASADQQTAGSGNAAQVAAIGMEAARQTSTSIAEVHDRIDAASRSVRELDAKNQQIGRIVETIEAIAQQTNLLALNAAIEAARAGDQGRGFAVVADEVRALAESSARETAAIRNLILGIRTDVGSVVEAIGRAETAVVQGDDMGKRTDAALIQIVDAVQQLRAVAEDSRTAVDEMARQADSLENSFAEVSEVGRTSSQAAAELGASSEEVAAASQEVAASAGEQSAAVQEGSAIAQTLSVTAQRLREVSLQFRATFPEDPAMARERFATFRTAHLRWVERVQAVMDGTGTINDAELVSHHQCVFGRWYDRLGGYLFGDLPEFQAIEAPHARLHEAAAAAVAAHRKGDQVGAQREFNALKAASQEVVQGLQRLEARTTHQGTGGRVA